MWHFIGCIVGAIIAFIFFFIFIAAMDDREPSVAIICLAIAILGAALAIIAFSGLYVEDIQTVNVTSTFIDTSHTPENGFLSDEDIEYRYDNEFTFKVNNTYKVRVQHNTDTNFNEIMYIYT